MELPFGLILRWGERVRIEEAVAVQMARAAGMPVPKVLCYGENPNNSFQMISILMTRLPGWPLVILSDSFSADDEESWLAPLGKCLDSMRKWESPFGGEQICSAIGTSISSQRVPRHTMGPFKSEKELHAYLLAPASTNGFASLDEYRRSMSEARKIIDVPHHIVFTHGDLKTHNILIDENYCLFGFLDWESAGWCPEYWEFTTAVRFVRGSWWHQAMSKLGGSQYVAESECDRLLNKLTIDSYAG